MLVKLLLHVLVELLLYVVVELLVEATLHHLRQRALLARTPGYASHKQRRYKHHQNNDKREQCTTSTGHT